MSEHPASGTGRYAVLDRLGKGGMGAVYRATDLQTGREVALKRLRLPHDEKHRGKFIELFHQEFRSLARLAHPNVVAVHDVGADALGPYYSMELLEGHDLHALAPLAWPETCALVRDVCSALALLHSRRLLHRDLSPRNVRRTSDGRAKLIDFGAMVPMGLCKTIVGTPPFVPPEALLQQQLDARSDLFAVGGTLYYALTGRHAYRAHDISQLNVAWATPPLPPSAYAPGIPSELDQLVLSLLSLEPLARPSSAAEVLDRLAAIASLPRDEQLAVSRAYLATPELVARAEPLATVRRRLAALHARKGGVIAIEGAAGMGRSRMLDTCVLEAKLARIAVVRASAADATSGRYGVLTSLVRQLSDLRVSAHATAMQSDTLALLAVGNIGPELDATLRPDLQQAFRTELEAVAHAQPVLIAIDDIERCDEPSLAALAVVAVRASDRVLIAVSCLVAAHGDRSGPQGVLLHDAARIALSPLAYADTEALLVSVFGDVPYLKTLAIRIHERAEGSPRGCMELSQYLLDHEHVQYEMGRFVLPPSLADAELPRTLTAARREKLAALSADARELAEVLSLCEGAALDVEDFAELTAAGDHECVGVALDELLFAQILRIESTVYVFDAHLWQEELEACMAPADALRACGRIADALARRGRDRLEVASYRMRADQTSAAIDLLLEELAHGSRWDRAPLQYDELLRSAVEACFELWRPRRDRMVLLRELIKVEQDLAAPQVYDDTRALLAELRRDSGLDAWVEAGGPSEPLARLQYVCDRIQTQSGAAPARERGFEQLEAIIALGTLAAETCALAARTSNVAIIDLLPRLEPFYPLSPVLKRIDDTTLPACRAVIAGRYMEALEHYRRQLSELQDPLLAGVPEDLRVWGINALHYALGNIEASLGNASALVHAAEIESVPGWLVPAHSIQQVYQLNMGNLREAERHRAQIEIIRLQSPIKPPFAAAAVFQHLFAFSMADDPNGMRDAIPELEILALAHPGMRPYLTFARAEHARICGNHADALEWVARTHEQIRAGSHPVWPWLVTSELQALFAQGRYQEVREIGLSALEAAERVGLKPMRGSIDMVLALAEAKLSDFDSACARIEQMIQERTARGTRGVAVGMLHEQRARIAVWMNDREAFEHHAQVCASYFSESGGDSALAAKYDRLLQEARQHGLPTAREVNEAVSSGNTTVTRTVTRSASTAVEEITRTARSAMTKCGSRQERLQCALTMLTEAGSAAHAELFVLEEGRLVPAASTAEGLGGQALVPALSRILDVDGSGATAVTTVFELPGPTLPDGSPTQLWPLLLVQMREHETAFVGIAALYFRTDTPVRLPSEIGCVVAGALIDAGDVVPRLLGGAATTMHR